MSNRKPAPPAISAADHARISAAVARAELTSAGEIVTVVAERSDEYADVALAWSAVVGFLALAALAMAPDFYLGIYDWLFADWGHEWTPRAILSFALAVAAIKFVSMLVLMMWQPLRLLLVPPQVKTMRVHLRAVRAFRLGAEQRTAGRTGVLIYLSMRERRAEIVADEAIATRVDPGVWGEAMQAMLDQVRSGHVADGMIAAVDRVGAIVADHFPRAENDINELPDRLIEV